jgi:hypothetical protein
MEVSSVSLCCGRNATGASILVDVNRHVDQTGSVILSKCLINAGDSSQRFCGDNRMKLSRIKCIILTSLAPHNVSGLPGMILCLSSLGVGHLKIFGPPGTQGLIDSMSTFINRRYPELIVVECGLMGDSSIHSFDVDNFIVAVRPVWVAKVRLLCVCSRYVLLLFLHTYRSQSGLHNTFIVLHIAGYCRCCNSLSI